MARVVKRAAQVVHLKTTALRVKQRPPDRLPSGTRDEFEPLHDFFVFSLNSDILLKIAKFLGRHESAYGVQRQHKDDRDREIGRFICSDHPFFPNTIIVNFPLEFQDSFYNADTSLLDVDIAEGSAYVIDGQHRLKAFASQYSERVVLPLVVVGYFGLELPTIAEIFTRINFFQVPVSKSVVYDLLALNKDPDFLKFKEAHAVCEAANATIGSPFYNMIKMLGVGSGILSQAAFVEAVSTRYKIIPLLRDQLSLEDTTDIILRYFTAIQNAFPDKWGNERSILSRTVGFNALTKILMLLLQSKPVRSSQGLKFTACAAALTKVDVDSDEIRTFGGFKGVNALAERFTAALKREGLL